MRVDTVDAHSCSGEPVQMAEYPSVDPSRPEAQVAIIRAEKCGSLWDTARLATVEKGRLRGSAPIP